MSGLWYFFCAQVYFSEHLVFLRQRFSSYDELWEKLTQAEWCTNHKYSKSWHRILHVRSKQKEYQALLQRHQDQGIVVIDIENDLYPPLLKEIYHAPLMICALGNRNILQNTCVAIVGTRKATEYGLAITDEIVRILASHKITLISGMAYGIDSQVHMSAEIAIWAEITGCGNLFPLINILLSVKTLASVTCKNFTLCREIVSLRA